jgi:hypothetical protein
MTNDCARLLAFYDGTGVDSRGRTIEQVLAFPFTTMEASHDYIQWLFPLDVPSGVMPDAPLAGSDCQCVFVQDPTRATRLRRAFERMLAFYGLLLVQRDRSQVERSPSFPQRAENWLTPNNHNFLRLTRIMKSLTLLGAGELAAALLSCLEEIHSEHSAVIGSTTLRYWRSAVPGQQ